MKVIWQFLQTVVFFFRVKDKGTDEPFSRSDEFIVHVEGFFFTSKVLSQR